MIALTEQQLQALTDPVASPPRAVKPRTKEIFVFAVDVVDVKIDASDADRFQPPKRKVTS